MDLSPDKLKCNMCEKVFGSRKYLQKHIKTHFEIYKCVISNRCFGEANNLHEHYRRHINEKPHFCKLCDYAFVVFGILNAHKINSQRRKALLM